jgi:hypothetical protein
MTQSENKHEELIDLNRKDSPESAPSPDSFEPKFHGRFNVLPNFADAPPSHLLPQPDSNPYEDRLEEPAKSTWEPAKHERDVRNQRYDWMRGPYVNAIAIIILILLEWRFVTWMFPVIISSLVNGEFGELAASVLMIAIPVWVYYIFRKSVNKPYWDDYSDAGGPFQSGDVMRHWGGFGWF